VVIPQDKAGKYTGGMGGLARDEQVEVQLFFVQCCIDLGIGNGYGKVKMSLMYRLYMRRLSLNFGTMLSPWQAKKRLA